MKPMKAGNVKPLLFRAGSTHPARLQRVKQISVGISYTALYRACVHSAVKGHLSRKLFRGEGVRATTSFCSNKNCRE